MDPSATPLDDADDSVTPFVKVPDARPPMPEPPPVRLVAVNDVTVVAPPGVERALDDFYATMLRFEREDEPIVKRPVVEPILGGDVPAVPPARVRRPLPPPPAGASAGPVYRAENHRLVVHVVEPPIARGDLRPVQIEVPSLPTVEAALTARQIEFTRQKGVTPGRESFLLQDPGGNWVEVWEVRAI